MLDASNTCYTSATGVLYYSLVSWAAPALETLDGRPFVHPGQVCVYYGVEQSSQIAGGCLPLFVLQLLLSWLPAIDGQLTISVRPSWWTCTRTRTPWQADDSKGSGGLKRLLVRLLPPGLVSVRWLAGGDNDSARGRGDEEDSLLSPRGPPVAMANRGAGGILEGVSM